VVLSDAAAGKSDERPRRGENMHLRRTERQVLDELVDGKSNAEIARVLSLSEGTVRTTASSLYRKLGVSNRLQAI
jgi:DNA-binding NarL/FixJ family response regulator